MPIHSTTPNSKKLPTLDGVLTEATPTQCFQALLTLALVLTPKPGNEGSSLTTNPRKRQQKRCGFCRQTRKRFQKPSAKYAYFVTFGHCAQPLHTRYSFFLVLLPLFLGHSSLTGARHFCHSRSDLILHIALAHTGKRREAQLSTDQTTTADPQHRANYQ